MNPQPIVYIIDDDPNIRVLVSATLNAAGLKSQAFANALEFSAFTLPDQPSCILLDLEMPGLSGLELLEQRFSGTRPCPVIIMTAHGNVRTAVKSLKLGAVDFLEKPFQREVLLERVQAALAADTNRRLATQNQQDVRRRLSILSPRERELLAAVIEGKSTKMIADELKISARTVDHHRANLMEKMNAANVADLVRMSLEAGFTPKEPPPQP